MHWLCILFIAYKLFFPLENKSIKTTLRLLKLKEKNLLMLNILQISMCTYSVYTNHITFALNTTEKKKK